MKYRHTASGTIFHTFDQERLWLAKNADAACIEGTEFHLAKRVEYGIVEEPEPAPTPKTLAEVKADGITTIKDIRRMTLDLFAKNSPGIPMIYRTNLTAAVRYKSSDATVIPENGQTPEEYLSVLGSKFGFQSATQFADYIIAENIRLGAPNTTIPSAYDVECQYGTSMTAVQAALTAEAVQTIIGDYATYCQPVNGQ